MKVIDAKPGDVLITAPIPATKYNAAVTFTTPRIVVVRITECTSYIYVTYISEDIKRARDFYVPNDFEMRKGRKTKAFEKLFDEYIIKNMRLGKVNSIGSDPEMFIEDKDGVVVPAFTFLGSKKEPNKGTVPADNSNSRVNNIYWDGFQAEFDTTANECLGWHSDSIRQGIAGLYDLLPKGAKLSTKPTIDVPPSMLLEAKEEHVQFGCMPSYNVYGMKGLALDGRDVPFRSAGGHIHFGIGKQTHESVAPMIKALDAILGVACVSLFAGIDDPRRRTMYGLAGEYRLPDHGVEYRTLSNAWMCHPAIIVFI